MERTPGGDVKRRNDLMNDNEMMWGLLLHLGSNLWNDNPDTPEGRARAPGKKFLIHEELYCEDSMWREATERMVRGGLNTVLVDLADGVVYPSHPEIAVKNAWTPEKLATELARMRAMGLEPLPKLNFSATHDAWLKDYSKMVSTPDYYRVCSDIIADTVEMFGRPRLLHLGYDEETDWHQALFQHMVIRRGELWWHDFLWFVREVESRGVRAWIWSDYIWKHEAEFLSRMPKSVLQSNWYYGLKFAGFTEKDANSAMYCRAYETLEKAGFDQVPTGYCHHPENFGLTVEHCRKVIAPERLKGFMQSTWDYTLESRRDRIAAAIDEVTAAKEKFYPRRAGRGRAAGSIVAGVKKLAVAACAAVLSLSAAADAKLVNGDSGCDQPGARMEEPCDIESALLRGEADRTVAFYRPGEDMVFTLKVTGVESRHFNRFFIDWRRSGDDGKSFAGRHPVKDGPLVIKTSLDKPGFVRILAYVVDENGQRLVKTGRNLREAKYVFFDGGAGVEPEKLDVCVPEPEDFDAFWARHRAELAKVPVRADLKEIPYGDKRVKVYAASIDCAGPRPATGYLTVPAKPGKYPIHLSLDGYGYHYTKWPRVVGGGDLLGFNLNAHGYEIGREDGYYTAFYEATKSNGMTYGFDPEENKDPETSYFSGMTYRLMRALQYLKSRPEWDGTNIVARGGSQGGLQTVWAAALDPDVTEARIGFPWLCDMSGKDLGGRIADSWRIHWSPGLGYYDPVNLARRIPRTCRVDIWRAGLGDYCCPPSGVAALYNAMKCPKKIRWVQGSTHNYEPPVPRQEFTLSED